jgi:hypothetical protein
MEYQLENGIVVKGSGATAFMESSKSLHQEQEISRNLFNEFINPLGFTAWHIHDGWVKYKHWNGKVLHNNILDLYWLSNHSGYSHTINRPKVGEKMVIINDSPDIYWSTKQEPFYMYCYDVIDEPEVKYDFEFPKLIIQLIEIKLVIYNKKIGKYQFYEKKSFWNKLFS